MAYEQFADRARRLTQGSLPQTTGTKRVIESAITEARNLNHNYVGTGHLLIGLLRRKNSGGSFVERMAE